MIFKVGDRIINKNRTDDKLPKGYGKGTIMKVETDDGLEHCFIEWDDLKLSDGSHYGTWAHKSVLELDIQATRDNTLNEILNEKN
jgi:hypothetical protein